MRPACLLPDFATQNPRPFLNQEVPDLTFAKFFITGSLDETPDTTDRSTQLALKLMKLAQRCRVIIPFPVSLSTTVSTALRTPQDHQLSGRALRKLPILAYATSGVAFAQGVAPTKDGSRSGAPIEAWLDAMGKVVDDKRLEREKMEL